MIRKTTILFIMLVSMFQAQTFEWVNTVPLNILTNPAYLHSPVAIDNSGNPVCARLVNFRFLYSFTYLGDIEIAKFNQTGTKEWSFTIFGKANVSEIIVDNDNNVVCTGTFRDTITMNTTSLVHSGSGKGNFILKLDASGNYIWAKDGTEYISGFGEFTALEINAAGNILLAISDYPIESKILKLDADGNILSSIEQPDVPTISDISRDASGNIWVTGFTTTHSQSFNGLDTIAPFPYSEYVVKYNTAGTAELVTFIQDVTVQEYNIETDNSGNAYLSGNLFDSTSFGNLHANSPQWVYDYFVTKINPDGEFLWLKQIPQGNTLGDATIGNSNYLACNKSGDTYVTGFFRGEINFGEDLLLSTFNFYDVFVISYNTDGEAQWVKAAGSDLYDSGSAIISDDNGNCYLTGLVGENSVFDSISVISGSLNLFIAGLDISNVISVEDGLHNSNPFAENFTLMQNYPNPFNPVTIIQYSIPFVGIRHALSVQLKIYDVLGKEIAILVNEKKSAGVYEINFDASSLPTGTYFYRLQAGTNTITKKMILLK